MRIPTTFEVYFGSFFTIHFGTTEGTHQVQRPSHYDASCLHAGVHRVTLPPGCFTQRERLPRKDEYDHQRRHKDLKQMDFSHAKIEDGQQRMIGTHYQVKGYYLQDSGCQAPSGAAAQH